MRPWIWKSVAAGLCGMLAHSSLMYLKSRAGLLLAFQPYESFQIALGRLTGAEVPLIVPWALSFVSGATLVGFLFGRIYRWLPGRSGVGKGLAFGVMGWAAMGLLFFPWLGLGYFAAGIGLGIAPALLSLAMLLVYSLVMSIVYAALDRSGTQVRL